MSRNHKSKKKQNHQSADKKDQKDNGKSPVASRGNKSTNLELTDHKAAGDNTDISTSITQVDVNDVRVDAS